MSFGEKLKSLRTSKRLTQQDLADALGVGRATIAGYETKGKQPDFDKLKWLSDFFNVSIDYLLGLTNSKNIYDLKPFLAIIEAEKIDENRYIAIKSLMETVSTLSTDKVKIINQIAELMANNAE